MSYLHRSTFNAADGESVNSLTPTDGVALTSSHTVKNNRACAVAAANAPIISMTNETFGTADYIVSTIVRLVASVAGTSLWNMKGRYVDGSNYYMVQCLESELRLYKRVGGAFFQLGSTYSVAWTIGQDYVVALSMNGTAISALVDGVAVVPPVTDSAFSDAGIVYLETLSVDTALTTANGFHHDEFSVADSVVASAIQQRQPQTIRRAAEYQPEFYGGVSAFSVAVISGTAPIVVGPTPDGGGNFGRRRIAALRKIGHSVHARGED